MKSKAAALDKDEKLFERSEFFSSVAAVAVVFSHIFIVSLDFFGSFLCQDKNERY
ncbi:hypothetical protein [Kordia periserrulae]|uniref:hypothetical protein n=1 Tax=Kordia periserrulae TaxID=701523 RepID=UPI001304DA3D|nr:hypothetical protein [Kordia periserrulae]